MLHTFNSLYCLKFYKNYVSGSKLQKCDNARIGISISTASTTTNARWSNSPWIASISYRWHSNSCWENDSSKLLDIFRDETFPEVPWNSRFFNLQVILLGLWIREVSWLKKIITTLKKFEKKKWWALNNVLLPNSKIDHFAVFLNLIYLALSHWIIYYEFESLNQFVS